MFKPSSITVVILAGGLGKRLRSVVSKYPKVLAEVHKRPFLQILLEQLNSSGFQKVVICIGFLGNQIKEKFGDDFKNLKLKYSQEQLPLGTGGGLRLALPLLKSENILVMNGDSFCDIDFKEFLNFHLNKKAAASLVISKVNKTDRFGRVNLGLKDRVIGFEEKKKDKGSGFMNAGIYLLKRSLISEIPKGTNISLETEIFPKWVSRSFYGYKSNGNFIDIGTPSSYSQAEKFFKQDTKRFILLDQDGTLIVHKPYLSHPDQIKLIPGAVKALKDFRKMGLGIVVITNQSGIGRGYFDLETLEKIHQRLTDLLAEERIFLDDIYFCPHTPEDNCLCRKPKVELIEKAMKKHHFDPKLSFVIGDNKSDIELGKNIGATTILVKTGYGAEIAKDNSVKPNFIVEDLLSVVDIIKDELAHEE